MAVVVREITAANLAQVDAAITDVAGWWDDSYQCQPGVTFPAATDLRALLSDATPLQRVVVVFDNIANKVYGLAVFRAQMASAGVVDHVRIRWLVARPAVFAQVAAGLCAAVVARVPAWSTHQDIWGCVIRDPQRARFVASGSFAIIGWADLAQPHPIRSYPDGTCIRYTGA